MLVSGAAGSVGAIVCQLGKQLGAKVYAIAGTSEKCDWLVKELGVDGAFNYKSPKFREELKSMGYLDVFFDNVGGKLVIKVSQYKSVNSRESMIVGEILDIALTRLNQGARIVLCGKYSRVFPPIFHLTACSHHRCHFSLQRRETQRHLKLPHPHLPTRHHTRIHCVRAHFLVDAKSCLHRYSFDYAKRYPEALAELSKGLANGSIKRKFHIVEGIEQAPVALPMLFSGGNTGKLYVPLCCHSPFNLC